MNPLKLLGLALLIISANCVAGEMYLYKDERGSTLISNKPPSSNSNLKLVSQTTYSDGLKDYGTPEAKKYLELTSGQTLKSQTILRYMSWIEQGQPGIPPLIPNRVEKQKVFNPIFRFKNGETVSEDLQLNKNYKSSNLCMKDKEKNLSIMTSKYDFSPYPNTKYQYECKPNTVEVRIELMSKQEILNEIEFVKSYQIKNTKKMYQVQFDDGIEVPGVVVYMPDE